MYRARKIFFGVLLITLAVCLVLWKLNVLNLPMAFLGVSTWGLIVSAIMVIIIVNSLIDLNFGGIFIPLAVICIIFDEPLGITAITPWVVIVAAILLTIAFGMLFQKHRWHRGRERREFHSDKFTEYSSDDENGYITHSMKFGSTTKYVRSQNFHTADLSSQFGEMSVFFDGAEVSQDCVSINCQVAFGEMDLYIPKDWKVENRVSTTFGHCDDRCDNTSLPSDAITCKIAGTVSFGELKLIRI